MSLFLNRFPVFAVVRRGFKGMACLVGPLLKHNGVPPSRSVSKSKSPIRCCVSFEKNDSTAFNRTLFIA